VIYTIGSSLGIDGEWRPLLPDN